ncbi:hypothetical protein [Paenibacillus polymyxa]|uniref:hypothetical protein n=1 Tax=Paenibacillus polymyxa TaxID=1406 RepID=UPI0004211BD7|nr:hypothetical protein [Paenibacillus polymyxa]
MSERTYPLPSGDELSIEANESVWLRTGDLKGLISDSSLLIEVLALVDSLQEQVQDAKIDAQDWEDEYHKMRRRFEESDKSALETVELLQEASKEVVNLREQLAERDRTIALLTEEQKPKKWEVVNTVYFNDDSNQIYGYKVKNEDNTMRRIISSKTANELTLKGELIFSPRQELSLVSVDRDYIEKALGE